MPAVPAGIIPDMWRLLRWAFNLSAAVSAVLFVGVCVLWVRSYWIGDGWAWCGGNDAELTRYVVSGRGHTRLWWDITPFSDSGEPPPRGYFRSPEAGEGTGPFEGSSIRSYCRFPGTSLEGYEPVWRALTVHDAWPLFLATVLPAVWLFRRSGRRHATGLCPSCGYDLRATPSRCTECGAAPGEKLSE